MPAYKRNLRTSGKKSSEKNLKSKDPLKSFEKQLEKEVREVENWVLERKKFFKKLAWVLVFITALLVFSILLNP